jgi:hypothetical protein
MLYERTALSKKPGDMIAQELATMRDAQHMTPALVMRDPYILDFLGPRDTWQESDLEAAAGGGGIEGRRVQGSLQRADGALPSLAGQTRAGAGGSLAAGDHPLHRKKARADRISGIGQVGTPYPSSAKRASSAPAGSTSI